ncbi:Organ specific protein [Dillenia turbinata]|uniref:Organ specific protein n=1 Tax=Dillenia turbinata TaxID=194707 RepID=A0AAN8URB2_9MAGN
MESSFVCFTFFLVLLVGNTIEARKDPGEYWKEVMRDQPMPEAIQGLVRSKSLSNENCHTSADTINKVLLVEEFEHKAEKPFTEDFEPRPNVSVYDNDVKPTEEKSFIKDFEPRPNVSVYDNDIGLKEKEAFDKDFEPRPNVSVYDNDIGLKEREATV